jgi:hypothetical protein
MYQWIVNSKPQGQCLFSWITGFFSQVGFVTYSVFVLESAWPIRNCRITYLR